MSTDTRTGLLRTPQEVTRAAAIAFTRIFLGIMWLFEVTVGHNWKIGGFGSDVHPGWIGAQRGDVVREDVAKAIADGTWAWFASIYETVVVPNAVAFSYLTIGLQLLFAAAFIVGFLVRPTAVIALAMDLSIFMLGNSRIPPFFTALHLFVLATGAGRYYGADGFFGTKLEGTRSSAGKALAWLIELPFVTNRWRGFAFGGAALFSLYFFLAIPQRPTTRIQFVSMELAAILAIVAVILYASTLIPDRLGVITAGLRIFVGYKFLHEIWARIDPGVNALPGWASGEALVPLFEQIVENHWGLFAWIVETFFLSAPAFWAIVFGTVQVAIGVMLVLGIRTRFASILGVIFLGGLIILGMTRYAPFLLGVLIPVMALDGGRYLSVDRALAGASYKERLGLPIPKAAIVPLIVLAAINAIAATVTAFVTGIEPGAYVTSMTSMTTAMVAIFSGLLAFTGWLQLRPSASVTPTKAKELISQES
jgi:uncharacterized membrane protein YphA (DoxX/SURF4 family)